MNYTTLFGYMLLGLTLAAPIGPVNSARLDKGLKNGFWHAYFVGFGSMIADVIFMLLVYFGVSNLLEYKPVQTFLWLFGGFVLIYSGLESLISANRLTIEETRNKEPLLKSFFSGFMMSITSPLSILFWLGIYGSVLAKNAVNNYENENLLISSLMIFVGLTIWDIFFASLTLGLRKFLSLHILVIISKISGLGLIAFGVYFAIEGIRSLL